MRKQSPFTRILLVACAVLLVGNIGWLWHGQSPAEKTASLHQKQERQDPLLSWRVFADNPNDMIINFVPLRKSLQQQFGALDVQKSFYFEYLPSGTSIRIGEDNQLVAASLIKVPLAMNLYRAAELGKLNLDETVTVTPTEVDGAYGDLWEKGPGLRLTLRQAAKFALTQSDNTAMHVMFDHVNGLLASDQESLNQLDIDQDMRNGQAVINAKSYASVLKSLYLSSYLQPHDSQELLGYLSHSTATNRLTKYLPKSVVVAHKIGVFNAGSWAESDCGIVYVPQRPYAICVMVGLPDDQANDFIANASKQVYDYVVQK
jgi:beta-lactamase class A